MKTTGAGDRGQLLDATLMNREGHVVEEAGYRIVARPDSWARRLCRDALPYWQGQSPRFEIEVKALQEQTHTKHFHCVVWYGNTDRYAAVVEIPPLRMLQRHRQLLQCRPLDFTGDVVLISPSPLLNQEGPNKSVEQYSTLASFHVTPRTWAFLAALAGAFGAFFGVLFAWLFQYLG